METAELVVTPEAHTRDESKAIQQSEAEVGAYLRSQQSGQHRRPNPPKLVFEDGRQLELSPSVLHALQFVLHHMARGEAVGLVPMARMLTTSQAAEILNISRPFLVKLLNEKAIKFTKIGTHHRLLMADVLNFKERRDRQMLDALNELANEAQEAGNYFED